MTNDGSSRRGARNRTKSAPTGRVLKAKCKADSADDSGKRTDWNKLRGLTPAAIRAGIEADPDAAATDENFWKDAAVVLPTRKTVVTMRLDADLLEWFRRERGYQTRINAILRTYMKASASRG